MENIKKQIADIINFDSAKSFEDLNNLRDIAMKRLGEGFRKMRESGCFTSDEIDDIKDYSSTLCNSRYLSMMNYIKTNIRKNFKF